MGVCFDRACVSTCDCEQEFASDPVFGEVPLNNPDSDLVCVICCQKCF